MTRLGLSEARNTLPDAVNRVAYGSERIIMQRRGKDLAALVSMDDLRALEDLEDRADAVAIAEAWAEQGGKSLKSWEAAKAELGLK